MTRVTTRQDLEDTRKVWNTCKPRYRVGTTWMPPDEAFLYRDRGRPVAIMVMALEPDPEDRIVQPQIMAWLAIPGFSSTLTRRALWAVCREMVEHYVPLGYTRTFGMLHTKCGVDANDRTAMLVEAGARKVSTQDGTFVVADDSQAVRDLLDNRAEVVP